MDTITVLGMGSFGTSLAWMLDQRGYRVRIWGRDKEQAREFDTSKHNPKYLSDATFSQHTVASSDAEIALQGSKAIVSVVPAQYSRDVWQQLKPFGLGTDGRFVCSASKGIEIQSLKTLDAVYREVFGDGCSPFAAISGPTFAKELVGGEPSVAVVASSHAECAKYFQRVLSDTYFRIYTQSDIVGVEMAGALKNVIAIATGIAVGLGMGENTRAAVITRGLAEITKMAVAMGGNPMTMLGLAGMGDLLLTCNGALSRNRTLGERLGRGETLSHIIESTGQVAEGVDTSRAAARLARKLGIEVPIIEQVNLILFHEKDPQVAWKDLMNRALGDEVDSLGIDLFCKKN